MQQWDLSSWSIRNPVPTVVLFLLLTISGMFGFMSLGIDENPNIDVPIVSVTVSQMGASPTELETQVTRKIEDSIAGIGNIKHISSTASNGASQTSIEFEIGTNTDRAVNDVRDAVTKIRQQLPQGIDEPIVQRVDFVGGAFVSYSIASKERSVVELSWIVDNDIARSLLSVPGVGQVQRAGGVDREVRVNLDPSRLQAMGVTADQVSVQLRNLNIDLPGGRSEVGSGEQSIRTLGSALSVSDLAATQIALPGGGWTRLDTLGRIVDGASEQRQLAYLDGKPVVAFAIIRSTGSNLVDVENGVDKKLAELKKILPKDINVQKIRTNGKYVRDAYSASLESLMLGALLSLIVIWYFVRDMRATVISSLAIPLSLIPTFAIMKWAGFTLNGMSLLALALVIGVLVDDAIVEIENIVRHIKMGKKPFEASCDAASEIALAVVATTLTVIVVFVPVAFMGGIPGQFFKQFGWTVAVAVFFSLLVARMLTPMMSAYMMRDIPESHQNGWLDNIYSRSLHWALNHRLIAVGLSFAIFVGSLILFKMMPTSLISNVDRGESVLTVALPPGVTLSDTEKVVDEATRVFMSRSETEHIFSTIGTPSSAKRNSGGNQGEVNNAVVYISLKPKEERKLSQQEFEDEARKALDHIPGARFGYYRSVGGGGKPLRIALTANDPALLNQYSEKLLNEVRAIPGLYDVSSSASLLRPEINVRPDFARAAEQGVSVAAIGRTAQIATLGDVEFNLPKFNLKDRQINIRVQLDPQYRKDIQVIAGLQVMGADGHLVPLRSVSQITFGSGPAEITRYDRARQVTIDAGLEANTTLGEAMKRIHELPAYKNRPREIQEQPLGDAEIQRDVFSGFGTAIGYAILLIYAVLVLLFGGFLHPLTIMVSLPLSLCGALLGLMLTGNSLGLYGLIGIVMLMGLVTKNAILLVEYCLKEMRAGVPREEAIHAAGSIRMQPIMMTTIAMIAGMLPIALKWGAGAEARAPMAIAVIGGLFTSTILTLVVVPVVFTYIDDFQNWLFKLFPGAKFVEKTDEAGEAGKINVQSHKNDIYMK
ncbi:MAG: efflux RND transporter permease subunit [Candidatus Obscuribacterales bacterium]|nr:efflux RND transporter permease subunit [Candidatus Obscuribacterales bacterium]